jgi:hypothetical protein
MKQKIVKIKIGIVGEHPENDAFAMSLLLKPVLTEGVFFSILQRNKRGSSLDSQRYAYELAAEFENEEVQHLIVIRDLDGFISQTDLVKKKEEWFDKINSKVNGKGIFFLAIYEMEALILADIESLNKYYKLKEKPLGNPMSKTNAKEFLQQLTAKTQKGKYSESDSPKIFENLIFANVYKNHKGDRSFQTFANNLFDKEIIKIDEDLLENHPLSKKGKK